MKKYKEFNEEVAQHYEDEAEKYRINENMGLYILIGLIIVLSVVTLGFIIASLFI